MLNNKNIKSGDDYAKLIIATMKETELETPENERTPIELLHFWFEEIEILADKKWMLYILGKIDNYIFSTDEMIELYNKANERYVQTLLDGLSDKGMVDTGINKDGEIVYSITEKGKEEVNKAKL